MPSVGRTRLRSSTMSSADKKRSTWWVLLEANLAMVAMSTSGPLGRYISLPPHIVICVRCLSGAFLLFLFCKILSVPVKLRNRKDFWRITLIGVLLVSHWTTYFLALQLSSVAVGMLSLFTYTVIAAFLEPVFLKTRFEPIYILFGIMSLTGVALLMPSLDFGDSYVQGVLFGLLSAFLYVFRNLLLKPISASYSSIPLMFNQLLIGGVLLSPFLLFQNGSDIVEEWPWLLLLAIVTTAIGHTMFVKVLASFSVTSISILTAIQPVYGILMGMFFLSEVPSPKAIIGGVLILLTVVLESIRNSLKSNS